MGSQQPVSEPSPIERSRYERNELLAISRALSSERDIRKLLDLILDRSRRITGADAGSVYVLEAADADGNGQPDGLAFGDPARLPRTLGEVGRRRMFTPAGGLQSHPARCTSCCRKTILSRWTSRSSPCRLTTPRWRVARCWPVGQSTCPTLGRPRRPPGPARTIAASTTRSATARARC